MTALMPLPMVLGPKAVTLRRSFLRGSSLGPEPGGIVIYNRVLNPAISSPVVTAV
jgi:hypothetical protein